MKRSNRAGYRAASWQEISKIIAMGRARNTVFEDWLELILTAHLSAVDNLRQLQTDPRRWDGVYERRYLAIVDRYKSDKPRGERPMDYFANATRELIKEIEEADGADCLGYIYEKEITFGEHGQYFTPEHVANMMAQLISAPSKSEEGRQVICDPACGSGRMLMAAAKQDPKAFYVGVDLDPRCAKMCALNMLFRGIEGDVYWGDSLAAKVHTAWLIRPPFVVVEDAKPTPPERLKRYAADQAAARGEQLSLL